MREGSILGNTLPAEPAVLPREPSAHNDCPVKTEPAAAPAALLRKFRLDFRHSLMVPSHRVNAWSMKDNLRWPSLLPTPLCVREPGQPIGAGLAIDGGAVGVEVRRRGPRLPESAGPVVPLRLRPHPLASGAGVTPDTPSQASNSCC